MDVHAALGHFQTLLLLVAALIAIGLVAGLYSSRLGWSHLLIFLVVGMLAGVDGPLGIRFDAVGLSFGTGNLALAVILLDGGLRTPWGLLRRHGASAGLLATVGVLITTTVIAAAGVWWLDMSWLQGALLGAIVSSTDAAAVFAQFSRQAGRLPPRLAATIEIESGLNDPMAVFLTLTLLGALQAPESAGVEAVWLLLRQLGWGLAVGLGGAWAAAGLLRRLPLREDHNGLTALLLAALGAVVFAVAGLLDGSGFLAIYLFGALVAHRAPQAVRPALAAVNGFTWLAQATMFLLLGLLVTPHEVWRFVVPALGIAAVLMLVARPVAVLVCLTPLRYTWREQAFVASVGLRGAVPIVLAMFPWLAGVPQAYLYFDIAFVVVLASLLLQAPVLGALARALNLERPVPSAHVGQGPQPDAASDDAAAGPHALQ